MSFEGQDILITEYDNPSLLTGSTLKNDKNEMLNSSGMLIGESDEESSSSSDSDGVIKVRPKKASNPMPEMDFAALMILG